MEYVASRMWIGERKAGFVGSRHAAGLVVNRSTARRRTPAGTQILTVSRDAGPGRIAAGISEHLGATGLIVLGVVVEKRNVFLRVVFARLLAIRTTRLGVDH